MKAYRQFYIEFGLVLDVFDRNKVLALFAAAAVRVLGAEGLVSIEYRGKRGAIEYRVLADQDTEVKIGLTTTFENAKGWIHVSCPNTLSGPDPEAVALRIYNAIAQHPELREVLREEEEKKGEEG